MACRKRRLSSLETGRAKREQRGRGVVLACSALKAGYRAALLQGLADARIVYLRGSKAVIGPRLAGRGGHFMNPALIESQFDTLEQPRGALRVDARLTPATIVQRIRKQLHV